MTLPLDLTGVVPQVIIRGGSGVALGLFMAVVARFSLKDSGRPLAHPMLLAALMGVSWGSFGAVCGIAQVSRSLRESIDKLHWPKPPFGKPLSGGRRGAGRR